MAHAIPRRLADLFAIADRPVTAALFEIASAVAAGATTTSIAAEVPDFLRAMFPNLSEDDLDRVAILASWGMYCQHTATTRELARTIGVGDDDAIEFALAERIASRIAAHLQPADKSSEDRP